MNFGYQSFRIFLVDTLNILPSAKAFPDQCAQVITDMDNSLNLPVFSDIKNIVVSGMGGSALGGRVLNYLERQALNYPVTVSTEYYLPNFVNHDSLVIISSYSGNTAETLFSLEEAIKRQARIFILTGGGKLAQKATDLNLPGYIFKPVNNPSGQPRMGLGYSLTAIIRLLVMGKLMSSPPDFNDLPKYLKSRQQPEAGNRLAQALTGKIPVLVSSEHLKGAVHCLKNQINETAKNFCVAFDLPELNHHLMEGLAFPAANPQNLHFVFFESRHYHPELQKRYPVTKDVLTKQHIGFSDFQVSGPSPVFEVFELIQAGGFLSYSLSQLNNVDPGPIPWVDYFKDRLK